MGKAICRLTSLAVGVVGDGSGVRLRRAPVALTAWAAHRPAQKLRLLMALRKTLAARGLSLGTCWRLSVAITTRLSARPKTTPASAAAATLLAIGPTP